MPDYRRNFVPGGTYFFTVVTHERRPLFAREENQVLLRQAMEAVRVKLPSAMVAAVLLPEHLHCIWSLPEGDAKYPRRWRQIKEGFTRSFLAAGGQEGTSSSARRRRQERAVWQQRYWEHTCRDQDDLNRCIDYIHWNPVKHGLVARVQDYPESSFHRYVREGIYPLDWGSENPCPSYNEPEWE